MDQAEAVQEVQPEVDTAEEVVEEAVEDAVEEVSEEEVTPEFAEIEYEGEKYNVPPELKDAFLRNSDYTKKTQEVAEQRRAVESQVQQFQEAYQAQQQNLQGHAQLAAINAQLEQFNGVDWAAFSENDPGSAQQAFFQYQQLKDASQNLSHSIEQQQAQALHQQRELHARHLEQGKAELARDIPGWSSELAKSITDHGKNYGFSESELSSIVDPRMVKVLHEAYLYRQSKKEATESPAPKPVSKVKGRSKVKVDPDKMSMDEWMKWRNKQIAT